MFIIVGLGNPGTKYQNTRHNSGFRAVDEIATNFQFPIFSFQTIFNAKISKRKLEGEDVILVKSNAFMNESGKTVKLLFKNLNLKIKNLIVIHDDIDIPLGKIRIVKNRGAAGHKGVESVINEINSKNFIRFRIGIQPAGGKPKNPESFVLQNFNKKEEEIVKEAIKKTAEAVGVFLKEGLEKTMNEFNK